MDREIFAIERGERSNSDIVCMSFDSLVRLETHFMDAFYTVFPLKCGRIEQQNLQLSFSYYYKFFFFNFKIDLLVLLSPEEKI